MIVRAVLTASCTIERKRWLAVSPASANRGATSRFLAHSRPHTRKVIRLSCHIIRQEVCMNTKGVNIPDPWFANLPSLLPDLEALYTDIHAHPELSTQETRTADLAATHLRQAGFEVTTGVGGTGVVGLLRNGDGQTVMLRADMDALPVAEEPGLPYASKVTAKDKDGHTVPVM